MNADGELREKTLENNSASVLIDVRRRRGAARVTQVARCPLSAACPVAPRLTRGRATRFARAAFARATGERARDLSCSDPVRGTAECTGTLSGGAAVVRVGYAVAGGRLYWTYSVSASGAGGPRRGRLHVSLGRGRSVPVTRTAVPGARAIVARMRR